MIITMGQLREIIRRAVGGSQPDETYSEELLDDPFFSADSVYVPNQVKKKIKAWARDMRLSTK